MGFTYILFHTFQTQNNLVNQIAQNLSGSETRAFCLLQILEYFASECEDENIVIEESLKAARTDRLNSHGESRRRRGRRVAGRRCRRAA